MTEQHAVKAVIYKKNKFLLLEQHVDGTTHFTLPGGRVTTENYENELKREVKEETGIDIEVEKHLGDWFFIRTSNNVKTVCHTFLCRPLSEEINTEGSENYEIIQSHTWVTKDEFLSGNYTDNESLKELISKLD